MASPNLSELVTTTLYDRRTTLADNVTKNNAILYQLEKKGKRRDFTGGRQMVEPIFYAENSTYTRYSGYDTLNINPSDVISGAVYDVKQAAVAVSISGLEQLLNSGKAQIIDFLAAKMENAESSFQNGLAADLYSLGTADSSKQIGGLQYGVADSPATGIVGGINRANFSFWKNYSYDATTDGGAPVTPANIVDYMLKMYQGVSRGNDKPDFWVADNIYWRAYWESLQAIQRINSADGGGMAAAGFATLDFMGAPVIMDGGIGGNCPASHMYALNSKYMSYRPHVDRNMDPIGGDRWSINQDATVKLIGWAGNLTYSGCQFLGVLKD